MVITRQHTKRIKSVRIRNSAGSSIPLVDIHTYQRFSISGIFNIPTDCTFWANPALTNKKVEAKMIVAIFNVMFIVKFLSKTFNEIKISNKTGRLEKTLPDKLKK